MKKHIQDIQVNSLVAVACLLSSVVSFLAGYAIRSAYEVAIFDSITSAIAQPMYNAYARSLVPHKQYEEMIAKQAIQRQATSTATTTVKSVKPVKSAR